MPVIELDLYAPPGPEPRPAVPVHGYRYAVPAVVLILVLALGGAAPASARLWRNTGHAPLTNTGSFQLVGGRLYTFATVDTRLTTTAWSLDPMRPLWRSTDRVPAGADDTDLTAAGISISASAAGRDDILLQVQDTSTVIDARTGAHRWTADEPVTPLAGGRVGLIYESTWAPGTEYTEARPGTVYYGDSTFHTEPPLQTTLRVVDLRTGRERWSLRHRGLLTAEEAPGDPGSMVLVAQDWLGLVATDTGRVLHEQRLAELPAHDSAPSDEVIGDVVLLSQETPGHAGAVTAYSSRTLQRLWQRPDSGGGGDGLFCSALACAVGGDRLDVLDPATGRSRWHVGGPAMLIGRGSDVVELAASADRAVRIRDRATGGVQADVHRWSWYSWGRDDGPLILGRSTSDGGTVFAAYRPARHAVQPLGRFTEPVSDCHSDEHHVACRTIQGVTVWAYL